MRGYGWKRAAMMLGALGLIAATAIGADAGATMINLPYTYTDDAGTRWYFSPNGQFRQQGNHAAFGQTGILSINGAYPSAQDNQAELDSKTGVLVIRCNSRNGLAITRRILINKADHWVRYVDIIHNTGDEALVPTITLSASLNFGARSAETVTGGGHADPPIGWVVQPARGNGATAVEMFGGKKAPTVPELQDAQRSNALIVNFSQTIPAGKSIAIMHVYTVTSSAEAGRKFLLGTKKAALMKGIPAAIRRLIVNFYVGDSLYGDLDLLRGDPFFDVVELRDGDQVKGTLQPAVYKLETFYGPVEIPAQRVVGLLNTGTFRPRQLLVTADGQAFGGQLAETNIALQLSSGQITQIPVNRISRMGYHVRPGEPEEWTFQKPIMLLVGGDRVEVKMPADPIDVVTRYGKLSLAPSTIAAIHFDAEDQPVNQIELIDGSRFAGLLETPQLTMTILDGGQTAAFGAGSIKHLQLTATPPRPDDQTPTLQMTNQDQFVGLLQGKIELDAAFDTLTINTSDIRTMEPIAAGSGEVRVELWDGTAVSGGVRDRQMTCKLNSGIIVTVPVSMIAGYNQPKPVAPAAMVGRIEELANQLNAEDMVQRDRAQKQLTAMGLVATQTLAQLRSKQSPEAQIRIDAILKQIGEAQAKTRPAPMMGEEFNKQ